MSGRRVVHDELDLAQIFISERRQVNARGQELADKGSYADDANSLRAGRCCYPDGIFTFEDSRVTKLNGST